MFDTEELNEVASLLHVTSEIAQNHPNLQAIGRACQRRLVEINAELVDAEAKEAEANKQAAADRQAKAYVAPKPGDPNYVEPEKAGDNLLDQPVETLPDNSGVGVERRV